MKSLTVIFVVLCACILSCHAATLNVPGDYPNIENAVNAAIDGDTVLLAEGTFNGPGNHDIQLGGKAITIESISGPFGTIIDCEGSPEEMHRAFYIHEDETDSTVLQGLTIINGYADEGGAIFCDGTSPLISKCNFLTNTATFGGAISLADSNAIVNDCIFDGNDAMRGNFIYIDGVSNVQVLSTEFKNATIEAETSIHVLFDSFLTIENCLFYDVWPAMYPIFCFNAIFRNCTFTELTNPGIYVIEQCTLFNCIYPYYRPENTQIFSCFRSDQYQDPLFVDPDNYDFRLQSIASGYPEDSPCIDTGWDFAKDTCFSLPDEETCMSDWSTSIDGTSDTGIVDIGYHWFRTAASAPTPTVTPEPAPTATPEPAPTATPSQSAKTGVTIFMPSTYFEVGDVCGCSVTVFNAEPTSIQNHPLFVILDVFGDYYFAPTFSDLDNYLELYPQFLPGETIVEVLPEFSWPANAGSATGLVWYAALVSPDMLHIVGEMDSWEFGF